MAKKKLHIKLLLLLFCIEFNSVFAQGFISKIYTTSDGLPDAYVTSIYQDSKSYLWIGTSTGFCSFNGHQFVDYGRSLGSNTFAANLSLEDSKHRFWIHTRNGVALLQNKKLVYYTTSDKLKVEWLFSMSELSDGRIWILTDKGIYQLQDTIWRKLNLVNEYKDLPCRYAVESTDGIYLNYGWQLFLYNKNGVTKPVTQKQLKYPYYIWLKKYNGQVYVNTIEGIYKINSDTLERIFTKQTKGVFSYDFLVDSKKRTWISTEKYGLLVSQPGNETELPQQIRLPFNQTLLLTEDHEHNVWASNFEGLVKIKDAYAEVFNKEKSPLLEDIRHLLLKPNGDILIKSATHGFIGYDEGKFVPDKKFSSANQSLRKTVVDVSVTDDKGNIWMVTREGDLFKVSDHSITHINKLIKDEFFLFVTYDPFTKTVYACGKKLYALQENSFTELSANTTIINPRRIFYSRQNLVVYTRNSGIYLIDRQNKVRRLPQMQPSNYNDFQLFNDPDGSFWITSQEGLQQWYWNNNNEPVRKITLSTDDGLPSPHIVAASFDKQQRLWLATLSGLAVVEKDSMGGYTVNQVNEDALFHMNNWGEAKLVTDREGVVWLSSFHDLIRFHPDQVYFDKAIPGVAINEVMLNLKKTDWSTKTDSVNGIQKIPLFVRLPYNENTISVSFDAITFAHNDQALFSYKLEGLDTGWQAATRIRSVSFANLSPGTYTFFVRTRKPNTAWSTPAKFSFVIRPPFWSTWWFQLLVILAAAALIALFLRSRIQRIKNKALLQQQIQELDLKALKAANALMNAKQKMTDAEMQALRAQMNPHFIYNALNSIQSLVLDSRSQEAIRYIGKFAKLLRQVLEHSDNNLITLEKELNTLDLYIQLEVLRMDAPLDYSMEIDEQLMPEKELVPPLIIQPYVENALWHGLSRKKDQRKLWVKVSADEEWLLVNIRDNGVGRQQAAIHKKESGINIPSKGMAITAGRLALINEATAEQAVTIFDLYDDSQQPNGTEVTLRIARATKA